MDQVQPCLGVKPILDGNVVRSDGTTTLGADDKAGIAAILEALEHVITEKYHIEIFIFVLQSVRKLVCMVSKTLILTICLVKIW